MTRMHPGPAIALMALLAACSTGPEAGDLMVTLDAATVAADAGAQDVELMRGPGGPFGFGLRADHGRFDCEPHARDGITITRTCTFRDAAGNTQNAYDAETTASVLVHTEVRGTITRDRWSATVDRVADLEVSGLAGSETTAIWNGTGSGTATRVRQTQDGEPRQYDMTFSGAIANVVIPVPRRDNGWPLSGTITRQMTVTFTGGPRDGETLARTVTLEFNGTRFATITVNGESFEFDLATRGRPHRRDHRRPGP